LRRKASGRRKTTNSQARRSPFSFTHHLFFSNNIHMGCFGKKAPGADDPEAKRIDKEIQKQLKMDMRAFESEVKLLLLGTHRHRLNAIRIYIIILSIGRSLQALTSAAACCYFFFYFSCWLLVAAAAARVALTMLHRSWRVWKINNL
jgi:hypothetical protein